MLKPVDAGGKRLFPFHLNLCMEIRKEWKAHLSWGFMAGEVSLIERPGGAAILVRSHGKWSLAVARSCSRSRPTRARGKAPSLTHRPDPPASPTISFSSVPRSRWVPNRGKQTADPLSSKEGQMRTELSHREQLTVHADCPLKDTACVLFAQTKDATIVCVIGCQITRTRIHTLLERLASARHDK